MCDITTGPLEELTELTAVEYLSDLKTLHYDLIRIQLQSINPEDYTLPQWQDAAKYLTGKETELNTVREVYEFLLSYCP